MYPSAFLSYVKSRKEYQTITDLNDLAEDKINLWEGDLTLNNAAKFNNNKVVLGIDQKDEMNGHLLNCLSCLIIIIYTCLK